MPFHIDPHLPPYTTPIHLHSSRDTENLKHGDVVESWDYLFGWDEDCLPASELEKWRSIPDPLVDDYLSTLPPNLLSPSHDQLSLLLSSTTPSALALIEHLMAPPPEGVRASKEEIEGAQECFYRFAGGLLLGTFYISLVGGFSSPRISSVLHQSSYLISPTIKTLPAPPTGIDDQHPYEPNESLAYAPITPATRARTSTRLLETLQFVLDILGSPLPTTLSSGGDAKALAESRSAARVGPGCLEPGRGEGWKSAVRVRLLHGVVRRRVMRTAERKGGYNFEADGYPLNAEDMTATLASFCIAPLWALTRIGSPCPEKLRLAYIAHWRHVGYYLGIPASILARHFDTSEGEGKGSKIFVSLLTHLFIHPEDVEAMKNSNRLPPPTLPLLHTAAGMPPFHTPLKHHFRAARFFLGDTLSDALDIPRSSYTQVVLLRFYLWGVVLPEYFGMYYPRSGWENTRLRLSQDLLGRVVRMGLQGRRSAFRAHDLQGKEGETAKQLGDLPAEVEEMEKVGVGLDPVGGRKVVREWRRLYLEMGGVLVGFGVVGGWVGWKAVQMAWGLRGGW